MNLSELFIRRPVMTSLLMLAILGFGIGRGPGRNWDVVVVI